MRDTMIDLSDMLNLDGTTTEECGDKVPLRMPNVLSSNLAPMSSLEVPATTTTASIPGSERSIHSNYSALNSNLHLSNENATGTDGFVFDCLSSIVIDPSGGEKDGLANSLLNDMSLDKDHGTSLKATDPNHTRTKSTQSCNADGWSSLGGSGRSLPQPQEHTGANAACGSTKSTLTSEVPSLAHPVGVPGTHPAMYFTPSPPANERQPQQLPSSEALLYHPNAPQTHGQSMGEVPGISSSTRYQLSAAASTSTNSGLHATPVPFPVPTAPNGVPVYFPYPTEATTGRVVNDTTLTEPMRQLLQSPQHASYVPVVAMNPAPAPQVIMNDKGQYPQFPSSNDEIFRSNLFVCGLPPEVRDKELIDAFGAYGEIESAKVMLDIHSGQSRGIAFVKFKDVKCAENALLGLNGSVLHNSTITVRIANSRAAYIPGTPTNKTFVRNVPLMISKERLTTYFSQFGDVLDVSVHADTAQGRQNLVDMGNFDPSIHESGPGELRLNIVFVTFTTKEAAAEAAARTHTTTPFPECNGTPLLAKVAEDSARRIKRLARRYRPNQGNDAQPLLGEAPGVLPPELKGGILQVPATAPLPGMYPATPAPMAYPQTYYPSPVPPYQYVVPPQMRDLTQPVMVPLMYMAPPGIPSGVVAPAQAPGPYYLVMDGKGTGPVMMAHA
ncbi:unnamed protein product [Phytomonas sp. EM1]|nr:unnamed protein product [Phytomonas sp. EM1]|eukprot:CCW62572.1 unnamed protein product [Phytomonas sp. isolate EM1]